MSRPKLHLPTVLSTACTTYVVGMALALLLIWIAAQFLN